MKFGKKNLSIKSNTNLNSSGKLDQNSANCVTTYNSMIMESVKILSSIENIFEVKSETKQALRYTAEFKKSEDMSMDYTDPEKIFIYSNAKNKETSTKKIPKS